jgi:hypothetical protein
MTTITEETINGEVYTITTFDNGGIIKQLKETPEQQALREAEAAAQAALIAAKLQEIEDNLPSWGQVSTAIDNIANLADAKAFIKKLSRCVYLDLKNSVD